MNSCLPHANMRNQAVAAGEGPCTFFPSTVITVSLNLAICIFMDVVFLHVYMLKCLQKL